MKIRKEVGQKKEGFLRCIIFAENPNKIVFYKDVKKWLIKHQSQPVTGNALRRLDVLACLISALIRGGRASLQKIGEEMEDPTDLESRIKKAKRWLNNKWTDFDLHFTPYLIPILHSLSKRGELLLAIDGSGVGNECSALMISVIWRGRAIPVGWVVRQAPKGHFPEQMHVDLINQVAQLFEQVLVPNCRVILLGDGEFDGIEVQKTCIKHNWDYVLKTAKDILIADNPKMEGYSKFGDIIASQGENHLMLNDMYIAKKGYGIVNAVYWHDKKYKDPLYLLTNLEYAPLVERLYRKRYCIETFFGDIKSRGFNIHRTKINNATTLFNLLIVACLAFIIAILFEFDARQSGQLSKFCRKDRIANLSVFQIGLRGLIYYIKKHLRFSFQFSKNFP